MKKLVLLLVLAGVAAAQTSTPAAAPVDKSKRPSPPGTAQCKFADGNTITMDYSRPYMKGRKIYGGLVPYDKVWRTGANEATTFVTTANIEVAGTAVPKGEYTVFTLPSETTWKLIISKDVGEFGTKYDPAHDFARINMKGEKLSAPVEQFTISFDEHGKECTLRLDWESTRESVKIKEKP